MDGNAGFEARWLAEAIRLQEQADGPLPDNEAERVARGAGGDAEYRICVRARELARRSATEADMLAWKGHAARVWLVLAALAVVSGAGAALTVLGDGERPVNVVWALGGLLGVHGASLLLWLVAVVSSGRDAGGALGRAWLWLARRTSTRGMSLVVPRALAGLLEHAGVTRWWLGAVSHGVWVIALGAALLGLLIALSLRRYGFVWETTILPADAFVHLVEALGWAPSLLGFATPDADAVRISGAGAISDEATRRAWSSWMSGCLVVYGIGPRVLLWGVCVGLVRSGRRHVRLDLNLPGYAALAQRLAPAAERIGVTDPAPSSLPRAHIQSAHHVGSREAILVGFELRDDVHDVDGGSEAGWPPVLPVSVHYAGVVDSRAQRQRLIAQLAADPPARLVVACDPRLSPDRGSLEFIAELSRHVGECRVWLVKAGAALDAERSGYWRDCLLDLGLAPGEVFGSRFEALKWLEEGV